MRFLSLIRIDESTGQVPSEQLMAELVQPIEQFTRNRQWVSTAGLRPTGHRDQAGDRRFRQAQGAVLGEGGRADAPIQEHGTDRDVDCGVRQLDGLGLGCKP